LATIITLACSILINSVFIRSACSTSPPRPLSFLTFISRLYQLGFPLPCLCQSLFAVFRLFILLGVTNFRGGCDSISNCHGGFTVYPNLRGSSSSFLAKFPLLILSLSYCPSPPTSALGQYRYHYRPSSSRSSSMAFVFWSSLSLRHLFVHLLPFTVTSTSSSCYGCHISDLRCSLFSQSFFRIVRYLLPSRAPSSSPLPQSSIVIS